MIFWHVVPFMLKLHQQGSYCRLKNLVKNSLSFENTLKLAFGSSPWRWDTCTETCRRCAFTIRI